MYQSPVFGYRNGRVAAEADVVDRGQQLQRLVERCAVVAEYA